MRTLRTEHRLRRLSLVLCDALNRSAEADIASELERFDRITQMLGRRRGHYRESMEPLAKLSGTVRSSREFDMRAAVGRTSNANDRSNRRFDMPHGHRRGADLSRARAVAVTFVARRRGAGAAHRAPIEGGVFRHDRDRTESEVQVRRRTNWPTVSARMPNIAWQ